MSDRVEPDDREWMLLAVEDRWRVEEHPAERVPNGYERVRVVAKSALDAARELAAVRERELEAERDEALSRPQDLESEWGKCVRCGREDWGAEFCAAHRRRTTLTAGPATRSALLASRWTEPRRRSGP